MDIILNKVLKSNEIITLVFLKLSLSRQCISGKAAKYFAQYSA